MPPDPTKRYALSSFIGTAYALREERADKVVFHHEQTPAQLNDRCVLLAELAG